MCFTNIVTLPENSRQEVMPISLPDNKPCNRYSITSCHEIVPDHKAIIAVLYKCSRIYFKKDVVRSSLRIN